MFPLIEPQPDELPIIVSNHERLLNIAIEDWDSFETSWDLR
jgi:hypothetical protein